MHTRVGRFLINAGTIPVGVLVFLLVAWIRRRRATVSKKQPPGPTPSLVYGNVKLLSGDLQGSLDRLWREYGDVVKFKFGVYPGVILNGSNCIKDALVTHADAFNDRPHLFTQKMFGGLDGIVNSNGDLWRRVRRFTLTALRDFGMGKKSMENLITEEAHALKVELDKNCGRPVDVKVPINNAVSNIICTIIFGCRNDYNDSDFVTFMGYLEFLFQNGGMSKFPEFFVPYLLPLFLFRSGNFFKLLKVVQGLETIVRDKIKDHRQTFDERNIRDFVDLYLQSEKQSNDGNSLTEKNLFTTVLDLFFAGIETSATTLKWAVLYMVVYPDVQVTCRKEISEVVGHGRLPCCADRQRMPYVDATLLEIQRICNIAGAASMRSTTRDVEFRGYFLPKGTVVLPNFFSPHTDPAHWDHPESFNPDRWLDKDNNVIRNEAFMPFSVGPRSCPGEALARMEIFLFFTAMLQDFEYAMVDPEKPPSTLGIFGLTHCPEPYEVLMKKI